MQAGSGMTLFSRAQRAISSRRTRLHDQKLTRDALDSYVVEWREERGGFGKVCYFSSFDPDGIVDSYVFHYLRQLKGLGYGIVFISTSKDIRPLDLETLKTLTWVVIKRSNVGLDFLSWKIGLAIQPPGHDTETVLFANDSVYGPVFPLERYIRQLEESEWDMVGFTDSWFEAFHVQSYFLLCKASIIRSGFLGNFFERVQVVSDKWELIKRYEIGFSQELLKAGFAVGALVDFRRLFSTHGTVASSEANARYGANALYVFWDVLLKFGLCPFIKRGIFRELPPSEMLLTDTIEQALAGSGSDFDFGLVLDNLKRTLRTDFSQ